jgi:phospholipid/cholesterol/gamma-HCH transport system substrate-binding protein
MFSQDVRDVAPSAQSVLRDVNPMLAYLKPYGRDLASLVSNFSASLGYTDEAGNTYLRLQPRVSELSVQSPLRFGALTYKNPYPTGGTGGAQGPFTGKYPRVEREPR